ncbi:restriction endonuclease subunit S [Vibrio parahaemolyticus]|uniref:restriction endonuclease subunit S n=2 Tax=Vibrio parahaemolyticus TaxID=670 RepID=UPI0006A654C4|nr:restriction endonuclease subunit S [Vibrio parahaemolyticus]EHY9860269.1 restriction endonuclease subunit S [Vibrio parahaemolyticus]EHY9861671.1 restriction endonuclease subunit S [Vibrio parahaemolyticus]EIO4560459.1 restriction endonuclease subunit S [Vibrio parahaemolyticus]EJG0715690.1 restriction endonuclease subunit S [Vibrio parahaemolyticus]EJR0680621.1 restriction endonuclease subunit S [Vibrio parahaemolyticus]
MAVENLITEHIDIWTSAVKAKSTSGRGSSKKLELYGVKKLRELILELAVRGKLVPQDPNDEPASVLLERIAAEKAKLVKAKKIKKQKSLGQVSKDEELFDTPTGWAWTRISEIAEISPRNSTTDDDAEVSFVPMPLITTNYDGSHGSEKRIWKEIKKGYTHFQDGDIALAKITPCFENSKAAVFSGLEGGVGAGTTELHVARPLSDCINPLFVLLYLKAPIFLKVGETKMTGSAGQKRVPKDFFSENPLPFPPSNEQHRIVAKVDELMALCDQLEQQTEASIEAHQMLVTTLLDTLTNSADADELMQNWARISEHFDTLFTTEESIDQLKQTILQLAVMGKLVHFGADPMETSVKDVISFGPRNGLSPKEVQGDTGIKVLKLGATSYGSLNLDESKSVDVDIEKTSHLWLKKGDILIQRGNSANYVGCNCLVKEDVCDVIYPDLMMKIRPSKTVSSEFLSTWLSSPMAREFMWTRMTGTSGTMPKISKKVVEAIPIIVPSKKIQDMVVSKVEELFSICELLKQLISETQQTQSQLTDTIVEQAI